MSHEDDRYASPDSKDFIRLPGLFRRWEIDQVLESGSDFHIEDAGETSDGSPLFAVYQRTPDEKEN